MGDFSYSAIFFLHNINRTQRNLTIAGIFFFDAGKNPLSPQMLKSTFFKKISSVMFLFFGKWFDVYFESMKSNKNFNINSHHLLGFYKNKIFSYIGVFFFYIMRITGAKHTFFSLTFDLYIDLKKLICVYFHSFHSWKKTAKQCW